MQGKRDLEQLQKMPLKNCFKKTPDNLHKTEYQVFFRFLSNIPIRQKYNGTRSADDAQVKAKQPADSYLNFHWPLISDIQDCLISTQCAFSGSGRESVRGGERESGGERKRRHLRRVIVIIRIA